MSYHDVETVREVALSSATLGPKADRIDLFDICVLIIIAPPTPTFALSPP
jgi:hypothetical protein